MTSKQLAIHALENHKGDDLYRAKAAFRGLTAEEMKKLHGASGKTRAEILSLYQRSNAECDAAIAWVRKQPD